jgi:hypothetical protein
MLAPFTCSCRNGNENIGFKALFFYLLFELVYADAARKFRAIKAWWQDMAERNNKFITQPGTSVLDCNSTSNLGIISQRGILIKFSFQLKSAPIFQVAIIVLFKLFDMIFIEVCSFFLFANLLGIAMLFS